MKIKSSRKFGFDMLTETKREDKVSDDVTSYESGNKAKWHGKNYTDNALILQSILRYSDKVGSKCFTSRELINNHLLDDCRVYLDMYSGNAARTNTKSKVENANPRIVRALEKLAYLELVGEKPYTARNREETKQYRFTRLGKMIHGLLRYDSLDSNKITESSHEQFYSLVRNYYESLRHAHARFCLMFFENCLSKRKFGIVVVYMSRLLAEASSDKHQFLSQIKFLNLLFWDAGMAKIYWESLEQLSQNDPKTWNIVMLNIKLFIEEMAESKAHYLEKFEMKRHRWGGDIDMVVLEGFCNICSIFFIAL